MSGFDIKEITSNGAAKIKGMFKGKKGKVTIIVIAVVGVVVFLALRNRSSSSQSVPVSLSGYPGDPMGSIGGGGGSGADTGAFDDAVSNINKNFADLLQQNNADAQRLMQEMQSSNVNQYNAMQDAFNKMNGSYTDQLQGMQGMIDGMNEAFQKNYAEYELNTKTLTDRLTSYQDEVNRLKSQPAQFSSGSSGSGSSGWISGSTLDNIKNEVINSNNYSSQTNKYISGLVSAESSQAVSNAAKTAESNLSQLQQARNDYHGNSTSTPGIPQASVAKVEVVKRK